MHTGGLLLKKIIRSARLALHGFKDKVAGGAGPAPIMAVLKASLLSHTSASQVYLPKIRMLLFEKHGRELALLGSRNYELLPLESISVVCARR